MTPTRVRIIASALDLFGRQGYAGTSISQIEAAAGLQPGSGSLYKHFRSKQELLEVAITERLGDRDRWSIFLSEDFSARADVADEPLEEGLLHFLRAGAARLDHDRDVLRIMMRDGALSDEARKAFRDLELRVVTDLVSTGLQDLADGREADWEAIAVMIAGAGANYWLVADIFDGEHPIVDQERHLRATAKMIAALLESPASGKRD